MEQRRHNGVLGFALGNQFPQAGEQIVRQASIGEFIQRR